MAATDSNNDGIQQLEERARAAAETFAQARRILGSEYGTMLMFPQPRTPSNTSSANKLSTNHSEIAREWEVEIEGVGADISLPMDRLGWTPVGSYGMRLYSESKMLQQKDLRMLGCGCFVMKYTQPFFEVIAKQFKKPEYVPYISLKVEPVCSQSPWATNADVTTPHKAFPPSAPVTVQSVVMQKALEFIHADREGCPPPREVVLEALKKRLTSSHPAFGSFEFVSSFVVSLDEDDDAADKSKNLEGHGHNKSAAGHGSTHEHNSSVVLNDKHFAHLLADPKTAAPRSVINTSCYCLRNGFLFTLTIEAIKEVHDKYVGEVVGGRIGKGLAISPYAVVAKGLGNRMSVMRSPSREVQAKNQSDASDEMILDALRPATLPSDHALAAASRGADFAYGPHRRIIKRLPFPIVNHSHQQETEQKEKEMLFLSMKVPLEWSRAQSSSLLPSAAGSIDGSESSTETAGIAIDPTTKRIKLLHLSSEQMKDEADESLAFVDSKRAAEACEPLDAEEKAFFGCNASYSVERFVTTPSGYSTASVLRPELVSIIVSLPKSSRQSGDKSGSSLSSSSASKMADVFAANLMGKRGVEGEKHVKESLVEDCPPHSPPPRSSRWAEVDPIPFSIEGLAAAGVGGLTLKNEERLVCRRFVCWRRVEVSNYEAEAGRGEEGEQEGGIKQTFVDFISDECCVYYFDSYAENDATAEGAKDKTHPSVISNTSSPSSASSYSSFSTIVIVRTIRPYDCKHLSSVFGVGQHGVAGDSKRQGYPTSAPLLQFISSPKGLSAAGFFYTFTSDTTHISSPQLPLVGRSEAVAARRSVLTTAPADLSRIMKSLIVVTLGREDDREGEKNTEVDTELAEAISAATAVATTNKNKFGKNKKVNHGHSGTTKRKEDEDSNAPAIFCEYVHLSIGLNGGGFQIKMPSLSAASSAVRMEGVSDIVRNENRDKTEEAGLHATPIALASGSKSFFYAPLGRMTPKSWRREAATATAFSRAFYPVALVAAEPDHKRAIDLFERSKISQNDPRLRARLDALGLVAAHHVFEVAGSGGRWDILDAISANTDEKVKDASGGQRECSFVEAFHAAAPLESLLNLGIKADSSASFSARREDTIKDATAGFIRRITIGGLEALMEKTSRALRTTLSSQHQPQIRSPSSVSSAGSERQQHQQQNKNTIAANPSNAPIPIRWTCYYHTTLPDPATTRRVMLPPSAHDAGVLLNSCVARMLLIPTFAPSASTGGSKTRCTSEEMATPPLPPAIIFDWSFVENIEEAMLQAVQDEILGTTRPHQTNTNNNASAEENLWPEGPTQFVRDWEYAKTAILRVIKEQVILPAAL